MFGDVVNHFSNLIRSDERSCVDERSALRSTLGRRSRGVGLVASVPEHPATTSDAKRVKAIRDFIL